MRSDKYTIRSVVLIGDESEELASRLAAASLPGQQAMRWRDEHSLDNALLVHELCSLPIAYNWPLIFDPESDELVKLIGLLQESIDATARLNSLYDDSIFATSANAFDSADSTTIIIDQFTSEQSRRTAATTITTTTSFGGGGGGGGGGVGGVDDSPSHLIVMADPSRLESARSVSSVAAAGIGVGGGGVGLPADAVYNYKQYKQRSMSIQSSIWETSTSMSMSLATSSRPQTSNRHVALACRYHSKSGRTLLDSLVVAGEDEAADSSTTLLRLPATLLESVVNPAAQRNQTSNSGDTSTADPVSRNNTTTNNNNNKSSSSSREHRHQHYKHNLCVLDWSDEHLDARLLAAATNGYTVLILNCERCTRVSRLVEVLVERDFLVDLNTNKEFIRVHEADEIVIHPRFKCILHVAAPSGTLVSGGAAPALLFKRLRNQANAAHFVVDLAPSGAYMTSDALAGIMEHERPGYGTQKTLAERLMLDAKASLRERQQQLCDKLETIDFGQLVQPATLDYLRFLNTKLKEKLDLMNESAHIE